MRHVVPHPQPRRRPRRGRPGRRFRHALHHRHAHAGPRRGPAPARREGGRRPGRPVCVRRRGRRRAAPKPKFGAKSKTATPALKKSKADPQPTPFDDLPIPAEIEGEPLPADEPAAGDPFTFSGDAPAAAPSRGKFKEKSRSPEKGKAKAPAKDKDKDADDGTDRPAYRGVERGSNKILLYTLVFGVLALGGGITTVVLMMNAKAKNAELKKKAEDEKAAKEAAAKAEAAKMMEEPPPPPPAPKDAAPETKAAKKGGKGEAPEKAAPKAGGKPGKGAKGPSGAPAAALALPATAKAFALDAKPSKGLELGKKPAMRVALDAPFKSVLRLFPPESNPDQFGVLWRSAEGVAGKGGKYTLSRYFEGGIKGKLEDIDGNDAAPVCDLSPDAERFALAAGSKVTVYDVSEGAKVGDGWEPYGRPEFADLRKAGLAAVFFGAKADLLATVATTGHVHLWEVKGAKLLGEFAPPAPGADKSVTARAVTVDDKRAHLLVAVGGAVHAVSLAAPGADDEGADKKKISPLAVEAIGPPGAFRPLALAFQGGADGRLLVVLETTGEKKEKAVMRVRLGARADTRFFRWPEGAGDPVAAAWPSTYVAVVGTDRGSAVFFDDENRFTPVAQVIPPGPMLQAPSRGENQYWVAAPDPADAAKTVLAAIEVPFEGYAGISESIDPKSAVVGLKPDVK